METRILLLICLSLGIAHIHLVRTVASSMKSPPACCHHCLCKTDAPLPAPDSSVEDPDEIMERAEALFYAPDSFQQQQPPWRQLIRHWWSKTSGV